MNIEKIEIKPNQYVWVDKDVEATLDDIKEGKGRYYKNEDIMCKIIAASPELNLDVPDYVEWLAEKEDWDFESPYGNDYGDFQNGFIKGYQTAEQEMFSEEDVRKAIELSRETHRVGKPYTERDEYDYTIEHIIELLKQEKK